MVKLNQKGFATNLIVLIILIAGVGLGVYLTQKQTQLKPKAASLDTIQNAFIALDSKNKPLAYIGNGTFATSSLSVKLKLKDINAISDASSFEFKNLAADYLVKHAYADGDIPNDCSTKLIFKIGKAGIDFKNALAYAKNEGACIYVPEGTYEVSSELVIPSNTIFFGDGIDRTIIKASSNFDSDKLIGNEANLDNISNKIVIRDMSLIGAGLSSLRDTNGILFRNIKDSFIFNVKTENFKKDGIYLGYYKLGNERTIPSLDRGTNNVRVSNCISQNNGRNGLSLVHGSNNIIDNCNFLNNSKIAPGRVGIGGIVLEPDDTDTVVTDNQIISNTVKNNEYNGIFLQACLKDIKRKDITVNLSSNYVCFNKVSGSKAPYQTRERNIIECKGTNNTFVDNEMEIDPSGLGTGSKMGSQYEEGCYKPSGLPDKPNTDVFNSFLGGTKIVKDIIVDGKNWNYSSEDFNIQLLGDKKKPKLFAAEVNIVYTDNSSNLLTIYFNYLNSRDTPGGAIGNQQTPKPAKTKTCTYTERIPDSTTEDCPSGLIQDCTGTKNGKTCTYNPNVSPNCKKQRCEVCNEKSRNYNQCGGSCNGKDYDDSHTIKVQKKVNALCEISYECKDDGRKEGECGNPSCQDDLTYCDGRDTIHKHGGYLDQNSGKCVYAFDNLGRVSGECGNKAETPQCSEDFTYCDNGREIHKTGGYYDSDDANADDNGCVYDFQETGESC